MSGHIRTELDGNVCTITLEKQGSRNAMDYDMAASLTEILHDLESRDEAIVVVMRGHGDKAFSAGFDLSLDRSNRTEEQKETWMSMNDAIESYTYPTIAMINGHTYGGAVEMAACCDIRIGVRDANFGITPAKIGLVYTGKAINRVMNIIGPAKTKEMLFTANGLPAEHAYEIGLLNYVVDDLDELEARTYDMAGNIATNAPLSLKHMKKIVHTIQDKGRLSDAENEWIAGIRDQMFESEDHAEGVAAFQEGRDPDFSGR